ncbi:PadR family transcriptional regulator [Aneurinibacillus danicus]|uniref:PadR family transcriptional regulator n=1 Tax=Aneurinibacillus danicus TaxID=267746 RepID=A0A511VFI2_9BACL|nr:PadR family transcriptional regulator [Aneurinibacillus danicus]GEN35992.1 PadR family transcriptional regulator [Aneurinibacillus danicus]
MDKEIMKGSIDILLLSLVAQREMYGYEMVKALKETSGDLYSMSEGTLYPALKRMEMKGWIESYWKETEGSSRRKYYRITEDGRKELKRKLRDWQSINRLIFKCSEGLS